MAILQGCTIPMRYLSTSWKTLRCKIGYPFSTVIGKSSAASLEIQPPVDVSISKTSEPVPTTIPHELQKLSPKAHELLQQHHLQHLCSSLSGSSVLFKPRFASNLLSSASLIASWIRQRVVRHRETPGGIQLRRILAFASANHPLWIVTHKQHERRRQLAEALRAIELKKGLLELTLDWQNEDKKVHFELNRLNAHQQKTNLLLECMEDKCTLNLHPSQAPQVKLTVEPPPVEVNNNRTVRGILIRLSGPRKGTRSSAFVRSAGSISISSDLVAAEEAWTQLPSKIGVFGLYIRIVYSQTNRLVRPTVILQGAKQIAPFELGHQLVL